MLKSDSRNIIVNMTLQQIAKFSQTFIQKKQGLLQEIAKKHSSQLFITHKDFIVKQFVDASFPWQTRAHSWYPNHDTPTMPSEP